MADLFSMRNPPDISRNGGIKIFGGSSHESQVVYPLVI